jgi:hypothetical protein
VTINRWSGEINPQLPREERVGKFRDVNNPTDNEKDSIGSAQAETPSGMSKSERSNMFLHDRFNTIQATARIYHGA